MDNFARCIAFTLDFEGGYSNNPADPGNWTGGAVGRGELRGTKFGISAAAYPALDIAALTQPEAEALYRADFYIPLEGDALPPAIAMVAFDAAVNAGPRRAVVWLQQACDLLADGVLGPETLRALTTGDAQATAREALVRRLAAQAGAPGWSNFGLGWTRRVLALCQAIVT
ncbi:glycoside hydrolase family 108 protein [Acidocella sp.]|uniref:glycoside hydrolase family 108 protein n=1 Tax=Acidocella sp. TaxID=50710 RepID=UPI002619C10F|nr:glycosyl hydrolase 108 family protein [Acidocella sp.]